MQAVVLKSVLGFISASNNKNQHLVKNQHHINHKNKTMQLLLIFNDKEP